MLNFFYVFEFKMDESETKQTIKLWKTDKVCLFFSFIKRLIKFLFSYLTGTR